MDLVKILCYSVPQLCCSPIVVTWTLVIQNTTTTSDVRERQIFRRQWHRFLIPCAFAIFTFGMFAYRIPDGVWIAVPALCLTLAFCSILHGGLIVSAEGIEWYVLHPKLRYRRIPWQAVIDKRKVFFGTMPPILLVVESGKYEPWVWGTPRCNRTIEFVIYTNSLVRGRTLWDAIQQFSLSREPTADRVVSWS